MIEGHIFDWHLTYADGDDPKRKRAIGDDILAHAETAAREWKKELDRFLPIGAELVGLPVGSWLMSLVFELAKPFTSKAEGEFHPYEERTVRRSGREEKEAFEIRIQSPLCSLAQRPGLVTGSSYGRP